MTHRVRPARLFVMYQGGMGMGDEVQLALEKVLLIGTHQILARLNREHFHAPVLPAMETKLVGLNEGHRPGRRPARDRHLRRNRRPAALAARLEKEKDENGRTSIVYALTSLGAEEHIPLLTRRFAAEDDDVRYATIIALASTLHAGSAEADPRAGHEGQDRGHPQASERIPRRRVVGPECSITLSF